MPKVKLYSVAQGKKVDFDLEVDRNGEIVATYKDETQKFPAGLTKAQFTKLVDERNKANEGVKARTQKEIDDETAARERSEKLLKNL